MALSRKISGTDKSKRANASNVLETEGNNQADSLLSKKLGVLLDDVFRGNSLKEQLLSNKEVQAHLPEIYSGLYNVSYILQNEAHLLEEELVNTTHVALSFLLHTVKPLPKAFRRDLLDQVSKYVNEGFESYTFISPEQTLLLDPNIHETENPGSDEIERGLSFAVIHPRTKKTLKYAKVITRNN